MNKQIIIIGAGASGVAAATKLMSNGFKNVTILEASNRIGGRIETIQFGENVIDLGAQWCHGEKNNVVYELAKDKNVLDRIYKLPFPDIFIQSNGEKIPKELSYKLATLCFGIYLGEKNVMEKSKFQGSFGNFFAIKFYDAIKSEYFNDVTHELARQCYDVVHKAINTEDGVNSWYETSCNKHESAQCEGYHFLNWKDKGFITVFDLLQNKIRGGESSSPVIDVIPVIKFDKEVEKITYNQPDGLIKVDCKDGSTHTADHLICTISLGVLKERQLNLFEPLLPLWKYDSIDGMAIGNLSKIFLEFDKPFWNEDWAGFTVLWKLEQLKEVRNDPINGDWLEGLLGFYTFNPLQPNVICGWVLGHHARKMEEKSDADVKAGSEKFLRMCLKQWTIPNAKAIARARWYSNPLFRGSYSCYTLKTEALGVGTSKLAQPINDSKGKPVIQFAGEATSRKYIGTVHGAIGSGWREADRIIDLYKNKITGS